jgi:hypothetical protein
MRLRFLHRYRKHTSTTKLPRRRYPLSVIAGRKKLLENVEAAISIGRAGFVGRASLSSRGRRFAGCVSDWINPAKVRPKSLGATTLGMYPVCRREFLRREAMRRGSTNAAQHVQSVTSLQGQQSEVSTSQRWHKNFGCHYQQTLMMRSGFRTSRVSAALRHLP